MHDHGTAVLDRPTEARPFAATGRSARQRWLDRCESDLAEALATRNACLLPVIAEVLFTDPADVCPDCHGTGYTDYSDFNLCHCMAGEQPAYDLPRYTRGDVISMVTGTPGGRAEVWVPCPECEIGPVRTGPYLWGHLIESPWVPDCRKCSDTGWALCYTGPAEDLFPA